MSTDNVTPIHAGPKSPAPKMTGGRSAGGPMRPQFAAALADTIGDQQARVFRLCNLIQCVASSAEGGPDCDDLRAAMDGLNDYARSIGRDLDSEVIVQHALENENRWTEDGMPIADD
jgi:hypothetical protein